MSEPDWERFLELITSGRLRISSRGLLEVAHDAGLQRGVNQERARVVHWLRASCQGRAPDVQATADCLAHDIERGAHVGDE